MEIKYAIATLLILLLTGAGVIAASLSQRIRDGMFFLLVAGAVVAERMDVHFFSRAWYRGTTRGIEISLVDILAVSLLAASLLAPRYRGARWFWPAGLATLGLYFAYAIFSVLVSEPRIFGLFELSKIVRGAVVFLAAAAFVRTRRELRPLVLGLAAAVLLQGALALKQRLGGMDRVAGSLDHANSLSMYLCLVGPVLAAAATADFSPWLRRLALGGLIVAAGAMMLTLSRAGIPMFALVVAATAAWCVSWRITLRKIAVGAAILVAVGLLLQASWKPLMARYGEATLTEEYVDAHEGRGVYFRWARAILADHSFGVGLNNWSHAVSKTYGPQAGFRYGDYDERDRPAGDIVAAEMNFAAPAHNLGVLTVGELGVPGLCLFALVWARWFQVGLPFLLRRSADPMHCLGTGIFFGLGGIFLQSLTEWVFRQTPIFITFHLLVGVLAGLHQHRRAAKKAAGRPGREEPAAQAAPEREPEPAFAAA